MNDLLSVSIVTVLLEVVNPKPAFSENHNKTLGWAREQMFRVNMPAIALILQQREAIALKLKFCGVRLQVIPSEGKGFLGDISGSEGHVRRKGAASGDRID